MYGYCCYCRYADAAIVVAVGARLRLMVLRFAELLLRFMLFLIELGAAVTASTVATADAPGTADAAVVGAIVERHLRSISLASFV